MTCATRYECCTMLNVPDVHVHSSSNSACVPCQRPHVQPCECLDMAMEGKRQPVKDRQPCMTSSCMHANFLGLKATTGGRDPREGLRGKKLFEPIGDLDLAIASHCNNVQTILHISSLCGHTSAVRLQGPVKQPLRLRAQDSHQELHSVVNACHTYTIYIIYNVYSYIYVYICN